MEKPAKKREEPGQDTGLEPGRPMRNSIQTGDDEIGGCPRY